jgi:hypothetical protein
MSINKKSLSKHKYINGKSVLGDISWCLMMSDGWLSSPPPVFEAATCSCSSSLSELTRLRERKECFSRLLCDDGLLLLEIQPEWGHICWWVLQFQSSVVFLPSVHLLPQRLILLARTHRTQTNLSSIPWKLYQVTGNTFPHSYSKTKKKILNKLRGLSLQANYTDRTSPACRRS